MNTIFIPLRKHPYITSAVLVILIVGGYFFFKAHDATAKDTLIVHPQNFVQQISVSGTVTAAQSVDLGYAETGRITAVYVKVGDQVTAGETLLQVDNTDAVKNVQDAENALSSAQLSLQELQNPDQLSALQTQDSLVQSQQTLASDQANLAKDYTTGYNTVSSAFIDIPNVINDVNTMLTDTSGLDSQTLTNNATALNYLLTAGNQIATAKSDYSLSLNSYKATSPVSATSSIAALIAKTKNTLEDVSTVLNQTSSYVDYALSLNQSTTASNQTLTNNKILVTSDLAKINADLNALNSAYVTIQNDNSTIITDQALVVQKQVSVNQGGSSPYAIQAAELAVSQAQVNLTNAQASLSKYAVVAPFDGVVTKMNAKVGESAALNASDVSVNSNGVFQIESYVPEVYISNLQVGNTATTTLDAYGPNVFFPASVIAIEPAQTVINGVSNYKTTLQFSTSDPRIKAGMTANISITTAAALNALVVPSGAVFIQNGQQYVQVKRGNTVTTTPVVTGSVSSLGQVQIMSGISDGDAVVLNPTTN